MRFSTRQWREKIRHSTNKLPKTHNVTYKREILLWNPPTAFYLIRCTHPFLLRLWAHTSSVLALACHTSLLSASEEIFKLHKHCRRGARGFRWWMTDPTEFLHSMMKCFMSTKAQNPEVCIGKSHHMVVCRLQMRGFSSFEAFQHSEMLYLVSDMVWNSQSVHDRVCLCDIRHALFLFKCD